MNSDKKHAGNISLLGGRACLDFVNTLDWSRHVGTISEQQAKLLSQKAKGLSSEGTRVLGNAIQLRDAIYRIFSSIAQSQPAPDKDLMVFNQYLSESMRLSQIIQQEGGFVWDLKIELEKLDWILNPVVRSAAELLVADEVTSVKSCGDPACGWLFLDTSRNKSRRWCDMSDCGNRAKASRFYKKKKVLKSSSAPPELAPSPTKPKSNLDRHLL